MLLNGKIRSALKLNYANKLVSYHPRDAQRRNLCTSIFNLVQSLELPFELLVNATNRCDKFMAHIKGYQRQLFLDTTLVNIELLNLQGVEDFKQYLIQQLKTYDREASNNNEVNVLFLRTQKMVEKALSSENPELNISDVCDNLG